MKPRLQLVLCIVAACSRGAPEPNRDPAPAERGPVEPAGTDRATEELSTRRPASQELEWDNPPGWTVERTAQSGRYRAKVAVPPVGNDRAPAELLVQHLGRADAVDAKTELQSWMREFDGNVAAGAELQRLEVGSVHVTWVEVAGSYQQPIGPPIGPRGKAAAHVIQPGWRGMAAVATAEQAGAWLFRLVGPSDTVQSARSGMLGLLRSLRLPGAAPARPTAAAGEGSSSDSTRPPQVGPPAPSTPSSRAPMVPSPSPS